LHSALVHWKTSLGGAVLIGHATLVVLDHLNGIANGSVAVVSPDMLMLAKAEFVAGWVALSASDGDKSSRILGLK
jgi:hypothetical protein